MKLNKMRVFQTAALACLLTVSSSLAMAAEVKREVVTRDDVNFTFLNPKRGKLAPMAGNLWGDRTKKAGPAGYLLIPPDNFMSPPHIHNISYRAITIDGIWHNDDPEAAQMWMPWGSFWTQPAGEVHITGAKGDKRMAYIEIEDGPYLVLSPVKAFNFGERPINIDRSNLVWQNPKGVTDNNGPKVAWLWGRPTVAGKLYGTFLKLPAGWKGRIENAGAEFRAIVIKGAPKFKVADKDIRTLHSSSYFGSLGAAAVQEVSSAPDAESFLYIRTDGKYTVITEK